jgi:hypothetical protein
MRRWGSRGRLEALLGESTAGMGFEIFLEGQRFVFVREGAIPNQLPRFEFGGVSGSASVVFGDPAFQVGSGAGVFLVGEFNAADDVDVPHRDLSLLQQN